MQLIEVVRVEWSVRFFEKKRPGRILPWRKRPLAGWRERGRRNGH